MSSQQTANHRLSTFGWTLIAVVGLFSSSAFSQFTYYQGRTKCVVDAYGRKSCEKVENLRTEVMDAIERFDGEALAHHNRRDEDCEDGGAKLFQVDATGPDLDGDGLPDDNREILPDGSEKPDYLGELSWDYGNGEIRVQGNGFQAYSNQVAFIPAHLLATGGIYIASASSDKPTRQQLNKFGLELAGCPGERIPIREIVRIGSLNPQVEIGEDWAAVTLEKPSCLRPDQLGVVFAVDREFENQFLLPGGSDRQAVKIYAFNDKNTIGKPQAKTTGQSGLTSATGYAEWDPLDSVMHFNQGYLGQRLIFKDKSGYQATVLATPGTDGIDSSIDGHHGFDTRRGDSGGLAKIKGDFEWEGNTYPIEGIVGAVTLQDRRSDVHRNYVVPFSAEVQQALEEAARVAYSYTSDSEI